MKKQWYLRLVGLSRSLGNFARLKPLDPPKQVSSEIDKNCLGGLSTDDLYDEARRLGYPHKIDTTIHPGPQVISFVEEHYQMCLEWHHGRFWQRRCTPCQQKDSCTLPTKKIPNQGS